MDSEQLSDICMSDVYVKRYYLSTFSTDTLPDDVPVPCCFISNTQPSSHRGEHWIAIHVDQSRRGSYFCSYGQQPKEEFREWFDRNTDGWTFKSTRIQGEMSTTCGQYCVCFLHFMCQNVAFDVFLSLFSSDRDENDDIVTSFVNGYYNQYTSVLDKQFFYYIGQQ